MILMSRKFAVRTLLALAASITGAAHAGNSPAETSAVTVQAPAAAIPVAARFVETRQEPHQRPARHDWFFYRDGGQRIETAQLDYAEIWARDERQELTLQRVFHRDRKIIEYTAGELRTQRRTREWNELASILDPRALAGLRRAGRGKVLGEPAVRYTGRAGETRIEVMWLPRLALPGRIVRKTDEAAYTLELRELRPTAADSWPRVAAAAFADFEVIDGSDLGDREYEPFVQKVLAADAGGHGHAH